jgi:hypothetical protein
MVVAVSTSGASHGCWILHINAPARFNPASELSAPRPGRTHTIME